MLKDIVKNINESNFAKGIAMIITLIGSKKLLENIDDDVKDFLDSNMFKKMVVFSTAFVATRNIKTSLFIVLLYTLIFEMLLNKKSSMCILKKKKKDKKPAKQLSLVPRTSIKYQNPQKQMEETRYPQHSSLDLMGPRPSFNL